jgi:hypothetical protein
MNDDWHDPIPPWLDKLLTKFFLATAIFAIGYFTIHFILDIVWKG